MIVDNPNLEISARACVPNSTDCTPWSAMIHHSETSNCFFRHPDATSLATRTVLEWKYHRSEEPAFITAMGPCAVKGSATITVPFNNQMYMSANGEPIFKPSSPFNVQDFLVPAGVATSFTFDKSKFVATASHAACLSVTI